MNREEAQTALRLSIGRLFRMASRPAEPGDAATFHDCRRTALDAAEALGMDTIGPYRPDWVRDRHAGAAGN